MAADEPGRAAEQWRWMGARIGKDGKQSNLWLDAKGRERWFPVKRTTEGGQPGGWYTAEVTRAEGETVTLHGRPEFARAAERGDEDAARWAAEDRVARVEMRRLALERSARRRDPLDEALAPLLEIAARLRTGNERDALGVYVLRRINQQAWISR